MKYELGGKLMADFAVLTQKTYNYLTDGNDKNKKAKDTKKYVIKRILKFEDYKRYVVANQLENKINQLEKNKFNTDRENLRENDKEFIKNNK